MKDAIRQFRRELHAAIQHTIDDILEFVGEIPDGLKAHSVGGAFQSVDGTKQPLKLADLFRVLLQF